MKTTWPKPAGLLLALLFSSCASNQIPGEALMWDQESLATRQIQTRSFDTDKEADLLQAAAGLMQDMGYTIEESETDLGLIVGSKDRDATNSGQRAGAVLGAVLFGTEAVYDKEQKITVAIVTRPAGEESTRMLLRATFQRLVWNNKGVLWKREAVDDPELYTDFFSRLSKAVFLEANEL